MYIHSYAVNIGSIACAQICLKSPNATFLILFKITLLLTHMKQQHHFVSTDTQNTYKMNLVFTHIIGKTLVNSYSLFMLFWAKNGDVNFSVTINYKIVIILGLFLGAASSQIMT